jgi:tetratricopeptide (TPR) repeat protein
VLALFFGVFANAPLAVRGERNAVPVTYSKNVAAILFKNCVNCHSPANGAPFNLLTYADAKKRARDIANVTSKRIMPPWLPEHGYVDFKGEGRLTDGEIAALQEWADSGAPEGTPSETPPAPVFATSWKLGVPDLIVEPKEPYTVPASGNDIYYNFVIPIPLERDRYVAGIEVLPGGSAVHHALIYFDQTPASRRAGAMNIPAGFVGMNGPDSASMPAGQLLGWNPGRSPSLIDNGLFWTLHPGSDLVLRTHLNPQGKAENVRPKLGFYFTNQPPAAEAYRLWLTTLNLDIPPGDSNYVAETVYPLPVDLAFLRVIPHAHFLCRRMESYAVLPDGKTNWLMRIKDWDFRWQADYEYKNPIQIPKGSKIVMRFTYDNSTNNPRNPSRSPTRVYWGPRSVDEMGELAFQTLPSNSSDLQTLFDDYRQFSAQKSAESYRFRLQRNPSDFEALLNLGRALSFLKQPSLAVTYLQQAAHVEPKNDLPHFELGSIYLSQVRLPRAYQEFKEVVHLNPDDSQAFENLGIICTQLKKFDEARKSFQRALELNPQDRYAEQYLKQFDAAGAGG